MITPFEERIYNNHLVSSRKAQNKPFRLRENFEKLDESTIKTLNKLSRFFSNYPHINQEEFFIAPHKVYEEEAYYPLEYYTKTKAISVYRQYQKLLELADPDSEESMQRLKDSLKFCYHFCEKKHWNFEDYRLNIEEALPYWVGHLKEHKINFYTLHALTFSNPAVESELLEFVIPDFYPIFQKTRAKFYSSTKMKAFSKVAKHKLNNKLNKLNKLENTKHEQN